MMELDDPQLCLLLLRACEGMKKLNYCWRTVHPSLITDAIDSMEQAIINTLREICVAGGPGFGNFQVDLAALPIDLNGLGIALPSDVAAVAYAASSISTLSLQSLIFPELTTCIPTDARSLVDSIMTQCRFTTTQKAEFEAKIILPHKLQQHMARCLFEAKREDLLSHPYLLRQTKDSQTRIQCMLASNRVSGTNNNGTICSISSQWLLALPNPGLSQYMTPSEFRAAIAMRLAIPLFATSMPCPKSACQSNHVMMDKFGYHILACRGDRNMCKARHDLVRDALSDLAGKCDFNPVKDAPVNCLGFSSNGVLHRYRPADLQIRGNDFNRDCIDVTVVSPISKIMGPSGNFLPENKAKNAEILKINKH